MNHYYLNMKLFQFNKCKQNVAAAVVVEVGIMAANVDYIKPLAKDNGGVLL